MFLTVKDKPGHALEKLVGIREWRRRIRVRGRWIGRVGIEFCLYLTKLNNKTVKRLSKSYAFYFYYDPREWAITQSHQYYDGNICWYQFGPFVYSKLWTYDCEKCLNDA